MALFMRQVDDTYEDKLKVCRYFRFATQLTSMFRGKCIVLADREQTL